MAATQSLEAKEVRPTCSAAAAGHRRAQQCSARGRPWRWWKDLLEAPEAGPPIAWVASCAWVSTPQRQQGDSQFEEQSSRQYLLNAVHESAIGWVTTLPISAPILLLPPLLFMLVCCLQGVPPVRLPSDVGPHLLVGLRASRAVGRARKRLQGSAPRGEHRLSKER